MKKLAVVLLFVSNSVMAQHIGVIDMTKNMTNSTKITFQHATNITEACNVQRVKRGLPTFKEPSLACSFWTKDTCLVITGTKTDADTLAHEVLHCIQGKWH